MKSLGERIKTARLRIDMRQEDLGAAVGFSKATISKIERGDLPVGDEKLKEISSVLDAPDLLTWRCETCPIRNEVFLKKYPELNNIERTPAVIVAKVLEITKKANAALEPMLALMLRKDFRDCPDYREREAEALFLLMSLEQSLEIMTHEFIAQQVTTPEQIAKKRAKLREHCIQRGHHKPTEG